MDYSKQKTVTESDIRKIFRAMNAGKRVRIFDEDYTPKLLTREQNEKGIKFLRKVDKTPRGNIRKNSPFGNRERAILENFDHFELKDYFDVTRYGETPIYVPVYLVVAKDGWTFQYHYYGGRVNITG